jgi:hypothetical protein
MASPSTTSTIGSPSASSGRRRGTLKLRYDSPTVSWPTVASTMVVPVTESSLCVMPCLRAHRDARPEDQPAPQPRRRLHLQRCEARARTARVGALAEEAGERGDRDDGEDEQQRTADGRMRATTVELDVAGVIESVGHRRRHGPGSPPEQRFSIAFGLIRAG